MIKNNHFKLVKISKASINSKADIIVKAIADCL